VVKTNPTKGVQISIMKINLKEVKKKENQTREPGKEDKLSERQPLIEPQPKI